MRDATKNSSPANKIYSTPSPEIVYPSSNPSLGIKSFQPTVL